MAQGHSYRGSVRYVFPILLVAVVVSAGCAGRVGAPTTPDTPQHAVDLRDNFKLWGLDVRPQGARNTCSVFVVTDALEYALAVRRGAGPRLSVEFLNWASNQAAGDADDGSYFSDLWNGYVVHGICPDADLPYRPEFDPQLAPSAEVRRRAAALRDRSLRMHWIKPWDVTTGLTEQQLSEIKQTLSRQWPVCSGLRWPKVERWENDVLQMAPPEGVRDGHSVLLVGFRDDPAQPGGGVFIFRNTSKNTRDGCMTYEYARAYMNDALWIDVQAVAPTGARATPTRQPR